MIILQYIIATVVKYNNILTLNDVTSTAFYVKQSLMYVSCPYYLQHTQHLLADVFPMVLA